MTTQNTIRFFDMLAGNAVTANVVSAIDRHLKAAHAANMAATGAEKEAAR